MKADDDYLADIISVSAEVIQEDLFVKRYLPMLFSDNPALFNMSWLNEVAKSPHVRVYVIDRNNTLLYSVPPLRESPLSNANEEITKVLNYIQLETNMRQAYGALLLETNLPKLIDVTTETNQNFVKEWQAILARYGYGPSTDEGVAKNSDDIDEMGMTDSDDNW